MKLQIIIFSFNRAMQLDTLLRSLKRHWKRPDCEIHILYNTTSEAYEQGYDILRKRYDDVVFHKENKVYGLIPIKDLLRLRNAIHLMKYRKLLWLKSDFRQQLIGMMKSCGASEVMFLTDDAMFIRDVDIPQHIFSWIRRKPSQHQYSLRLGKGMNHQPAEVNEADDYLWWNTYEVPQTDNWGYHFSVDAHIYDKNLILGFYKKLVFANPNTLEGYVCAELRRKHCLSRSRCPKEACLLSYPINMVQNEVENETLGVSTEEMNKRFLQGFNMTYPIPEKIDTFQQYPSFITMEKSEESLIFKTKQ